MGTKWGHSEVNEADLFLSDLPVSRDSDEFGMGETQRIDCTQHKSSLKSTVGNSEIALFTF